ncbi:MAG: alpha/beta hydrolase [Agathobacter sp.]
MIVVWTAAGVLLLFAVALYVIYDICFSGNKRYMGDEHDLPQGEQYVPYHDVITRCVDKVMQDVFEEVSVVSHDGLKLYGRYYHRRDNAPLIIFFHGYRCCSLRDGNGIFLYSKTLHYNILLVDQRAHGKSEGKTISFGVKERYDCFRWIEWAQQRLGTEIQIILAGLSMGAATVLMTADMGLPNNVKGIMADCPYSSPKAVIRKVIKDMNFPVGIVYWLAKYAAKWIGKFDLEETSAVEAVRRAKIPILIIHGDDDRFVPCTMSQECVEACRDNVELVLVEGAGHGMSHCVDAKKYEDAVLAFFRKTLGE